MKRLLLALALAASVACAGSFKANAVGSYSAVQILLDGVDDGARILCFGTTNLDGLPHPWHCTAGTPGLSDVTYQKIAEKLVTAYDTQIRLAPVIKAEKVADTTDRVDLIMLATLAGDVRDLADAIVPSDGVAVWAGQVHRWLAAVDQARKTIGGAK